MQPSFLECLAQSATSHLEGDVAAGVGLEDLVVEGGHREGIVVGMPTTWKVR